VRRHRAHAPLCQCEQTCEACSPASGTIDTPSSQGVQWTHDTIDNEFAGKKSSKSEWCSNIWLLQGLSLCAHFHLKFCCVPSLKSCGLAMVGVSCQTCFCQCLAFLLWTQVAQTVRLSLGPRGEATAFSPSMLLAWQLQHYFPVPLGAQSAVSSIDGDSLETGVMTMTAMQSATYSKTASNRASPKQVARSLDRASKSQLDKRKRDLICTTRILCRMQHAVSGGN